MAITTHGRLLVSGGCEGQVMKIKQHIPFI